jgi:hypothetical protein
MVLVSTSLQLPENGSIGQPNHSNHNQNDKGNHPVHIPLRKRHGQHPSTDKQKDNLKSESKFDVIGRLLSDHENG